METMKRRNAENDEDERANEADQNKSTHEHLSKRQKTETENLSSPEPAVEVVQGINKSDQSKSTEYLSERQRENENLSSAQLNNQGTKEADHNKIAEHSSKRQRENENPSSVQLNNQGNNEADQSKSTEHSSKRKRTGETTIEENPYLAHLNKPNQASS